jgi:hypothetical protein
MKIKDDSFTIVLVGNWNQYILEPGWIGREIFEEGKIQVEFAINTGSPPRYTSATNIRMIPSDERVVFIALSPSDETLEKMESMVIKLFQKLPYTPLTSFGINFGFVEDIGDFSLPVMFEFPDKDLLIEHGALIKKSSVKRSLIIEDRILNLSLDCNGKNVFLNFNFHYPVKGTSEAQEKIKDTVKKNRHITEGLLKDIYKLEYDLVKEERE